MNYYAEYENDFDDEYIEEDPNEDDFPSAHANRRMKNDENESAFFEMEQNARNLIEEGKYRTGMETFEKCIEVLLNSSPDGPQSFAFQEFIERTIRFLNDIALKLLQEDKVQPSMALLEKCQAWTHPEKYGVYPALRSLTFNHIGCCYRRLGKLDKALFYLEKALQFISGMEKVETSGITHINLCAVLSQLGEHQRALEHASSAVSECAYDFVQVTKIPEIDEETIIKKAQMLAIAYHNLGTEEEACRNLEAAAQSYFKAFRVAEEHLSHLPQLIDKFRASYDQVKDRIMRKNLRDSQLQKIGSSSPKRFSRLTDSSPKVIVRRPPSARSHAAKVYMHQNKVIIPKRNQPALQNNFMPNSIAANKMFVPGTAGLSGTGSAVRTPKQAIPQRNRPNTANPSMRNFNYQPEGLNSKDRSRKESSHQQIAQSEAISELERLGLDDEEELSKVDMKSNRVAFLESLNQYDSKFYANSKRRPDIHNQSDQLSNSNEDFQYTHSKVGGTRDLLVSDPSAFNQKSHQSEHSGKGKSPKVESKKAGSSKIDPSKERAMQLAAIFIQKLWRGYQARKAYQRRRKPARFITCLTETVRENLENDPYVKNPRYYVLMMFEETTQVLHIHIKNLNNKKFFKGWLEFQPSTTRNKSIMVKELRVACERLLPNIYIQGNNIVFNEVADIEEISPENSHRKNFEPVNSIQEVTERTERSSKKSLPKPKRDVSEEQFQEVEVDEEIAEEEELANKPAKKQESDRYNKPQSPAQKKEENKPSKKHPPPLDDYEEEEHHFEEVDLDPIEDSDEPVKPIIKEEPKPQPKQEPKQEPKEEPKFQPKVEEPKKEDSFEVESPKSKSSRKSSSSSSKKPTKKQIEAEEEEEAEPEPKRTPERLIINRKKQEAAALKIQKNFRGRLARKKFDIKKNSVYIHPPVVSRRFMADGYHMIGVQVLEKRPQHMVKGEEPGYNIFYYDYTDKKSFNKLFLPKDIIPKDLIKFELLQSIIQVNVAKHTVKFAKDLKEIKKQIEQEQKIERSLEPEAFQSEESSRKDNSVSRIEGAEYLTTVPITFDDITIRSQILYHPAQNQVIVIPENDRDAKNNTLRIPIEHMGLKKFDSEHFLQNMDFLLLARLDYRQGRLIFDTSVLDPKGESGRTTPQPFSLQNLRKDSDVGKKENREPVEKEQIKEVENRRYTSQAEEEEAYSEVIGHGSKEFETFEPKPQKKDDKKERLSDLNDPDANEAALKIQNAFRSKKEIAKAKQKKEELRRQREEERRKQKEKEEEEKRKQREREEEERRIKEEQEKTKQSKKDDDELPDLEDKDIQDATLKIQNAYKNKKERQRRREEQERLEKEKAQKEQEEARRKATEEQQLKEHETVREYELELHREERIEKPTKPNKRPKDKDLPDLEDKDAQDAAIKIQKAFRNKQAKQNTKLLKQESPKTEQHTQKDSSLFNPEKTEGEKSSNVQQEQKDTLEQSKSLQSLQSISKFGFIDSNYEAGGYHNIPDPSKPMRIEPEKPQPQSYSTPKKENKERVEQSPPKAKPREERIGVEILGNFLAGQIIPQVERELPKPEDAKKELESMTKDNKAIGFSKVLGFGNLATPEKPRNSSPAKEESKTVSYIEKVISQDPLPTLGRDQIPNPLHASGNIGQNTQQPYMSTPERRKNFESEHYKKVLETFVQEKDTKATQKVEETKPANTEFAWHNEKPSETKLRQESAKKTETEEYNEPYEEDGEDDGGDMFTKIEPKKQEEVQKQPENGKNTRGDMFTNLQGGQRDLYGEEVDYQEEDEPYEENFEEDQGEGEYQQEYQEVDYENRDTIERESPRANSGELSIQNSDNDYDI